MSRKIGYCLRFILLAAFAFIAGVPLLMVFSGSFLGSQEANEALGSVLGSGKGYAGWPAFPLYPTLRYFLELLIDTPKFYIMFWNSCKQVFLILAGQAVVALLAAWGFARYRFFGRKVLFLVYIVLMIMPFQVTMVSSYLVLDGMKLMDTMWAVVVPNIFATFPVFVMVKFFAAIPDALIEAAEVEGAGGFTIFLKLGIPMGIPGILAAMILGFLEYWNNIEQPLTFLRDKSQWPLSLYLPNITVANISISMVASVITLLPALLIFLSGQKYLEQGIIASGVKG